MSKIIDQDEHCRQQWAVMCAKAGLPEAAEIHPNGGSTAGELHEARKIMRRAVNQMQANLPAKDLNDDYISGIHHAGKVIASLSTRIDRMETPHPGDARKPANHQGLNVLRNSADFARHYRTDDHFGHKFEEEGEIQIHDFLRGVANMTTTQSVRNALSVGTDTAGGFSVPSRLMPGILSALVPVSSLMQAGVGILPLEDGAKTYTTAAVNAIPTASWRSEAGTLATSDTTFRAIVANLFTAVQDILSDDAPMPTAAIMSPRSLVTLGGLVDTTGQPLGVPRMLENVRLIGTSQVPNNLTVGSSTDCSEIYVGDFSKMYFAMRESVSVQMLTELHAGTGEIGFACHMRADVVLTYPAAFAVVTGVRP